MVNVTATACRQADHFGCPRRERWVANPWIRRVGYLGPIIGVKQDFIEKFGLAAGCGNAQFCLGANLFSHQYVPFCLMRGSELQATVSGCTQAFSGDLRQRHSCNLIKRSKHLHTLGGPSDRVLHVIADAEKLACQYHGPHGTVRCLARSMMFVDCKPPCRLPGLHASVSLVQIVGQCGGVAVDHP